MITTTDTLLESIKRGITLPEASADLDDAAILAIADEEIASLIVPEIIKLRSEFLVGRSRADLVSGVSAYEIPYRAVGRRLREICLVDSSGSRRNLRAISPEESYSFSSTGEPVGFYLESDSVILLPTPGSTGAQLEMSYFVRPSKLVRSDAVAKIASIDRIAGVVTVQALPSTMIGVQSFDFIKGKDVHKIRAMDVATSGFTGMQITVAVALIPQTLIVGDVIAIAGESHVVPLPDECLPLIAQATQNRLLEALGDFEALGAAVAKLDQKILSMRTLLSIQVEGERAKLSLNNSLLSSRGSSGRRFNTRW